MLNRYPYVFFCVLFIFITIFLVQAASLVHKIVQPIEDKLQSSITTVKEKIKKKLPTIDDNPYKSQVAHVRVGNNLSPEEREVLKKRMSNVKQSLESLLGMSLEKKRTPLVACVCSGGAYRALFGMMGFFLAAHEIGLLGTIAYASSLSGSTWFLASWITSGLPINEFVTQFMNQNISLTQLTPHESNLIATSVLTKYVFNQPITLSDFWGAVLANVLLKPLRDMRQRVGLSDQIKIIRNGDFPIPLYTATQGVKGMQSQYEWYEFNPFEIGSAWLKMFIPTWAFNRIFDNGVSTNFAPENSLASLMGIWGNAYAASFDRMYQEIGNKIPTYIDKAVMKQILKHIGDKHVTTSQINNFTKGIQASPLSKLDFLSLGDSGFDFNLPYPPISGERPERKADIIIFFDISEGALGFSSHPFKRLLEYVQRKGLKFPQTNYSDIQDKSMVIFKDEHDLDVPLVIYIAGVSDNSLWKEYERSASQSDVYIQELKDFDMATCMKNFLCHSGNFFINKGQAQKIMRLCQFNVVQNKNKIVDALREWVSTH